MPSVCKTLTLVSSLSGLLTVGLFLMPAIASMPAVLKDEHRAIAPQPTDLLARADADLVDVALAQGNFDIFIQLLVELGMAEDLRGYGRFTVFAPTNAAFEALPRPTLAALLNNRELLARVLAYHVIAERRPIVSTDVTDPIRFRTLERSEAVINRRGRTLYVNGVAVTTPDIEASNGVIHAIDDVLIPDSVRAELP